MSCEDCAKAVIHTGTPTGTYETIGGVKTYVATPTGEYDKTNAILFLGDAFGLYTNALLISDSFAKSGFKTYFPDIVHEDPFLHGMETNPNFYAIFQEWFESHGDETTRALIDPVVKELKAAGIADLAVVGYCFGGKHAIDLAVENEVKVVAVSHPSRVEVPAALEGLLAHSKAPLLINACEFDMAWTAEYQAKATEILGSKYAPGFKQNYYLGCTHGFAIRAELSVPAQKAGLEGAFEETAKWFKKYL